MQLSRFTFFFYFKIVIFVGNDAMKLSLLIECHVLERILKANNQNKESMIGAFALLTNFEINLNI